MPLFRGLRGARRSRSACCRTRSGPGSTTSGVFARDGVLDLIDGAVYTSEIAHAKPHREAFRRRAGAPSASSDPAACVYVGDRPYEDVHGAQRAGMRAVLVPHSDIPADQQVPVDVVPDAVVHRLVDVLDVVDGWASGRPGLLD